MTDSDPRAVSPVCPSCRAAYGAGALMRGPIAPPPGAEPGRYFVCDRCNYTLKDRRRRSRPPLSEGPVSRW